jgi:CheY-like chemotaxis protein
MINPKDMSVFIIRSMESLVGQTTSAIYLYLLKNSHGLDVSNPQEILNNPAIFENAISSLLNMTAANFFSELNSGLAAICSVTDSDYSQYKSGDFSRLINKIKNQVSVNRMEEKFPETPGTHKVNNTISSGSMPTDSNYDDRHKQAEKIKVLVADDNKELLEVLSFYLQHKNVLCDTALSGIDALSAIKNIDYDVIFLDAELSGPKGQSIIDELSEQNLLASRNVLLFASPDDSESQSMLSSGIKGFLSKPTSVEEISETIERITNRVIYDI